MFKAVVTETEGTGAGYGFPPHIYMTGLGVAMSKSPKKALAHARRICGQSILKDNIEQGCQGVGQIPVYGETSLYKNGKRIFHFD